MIYMGLQQPYACTHIFRLVNKSSRLRHITWHIKVSRSYRLLILRAYCVAAQIKSRDARQMNVEEN